MQSPFLQICHQKNLFYPNNFSGQTTILLGNTQKELEEIMNIYEIEDTTIVEKFLSEVQLQCINRIEANLSVYSNDILLFREYLQKALPLLSRQSITMKKLSLVGLNIMKNAQYFASALKLLEKQLKNSGFELPNMNEADAFVQTISSQKQEIFFQVMTHFFHPNSPYLNNKINRVETRLEDNENDKIFLFQEVDKMLRNSRGQIGYILQKMYLLSQIFHLYRRMFNIDHRIILFQIRKQFKQNQCEAINLQNYAKAIHESAIAFKTYLIKITPEFKLSAVQKQIQLQTQEKNGPKKNSKQPQLSFRSKVFSYIQTLFRPQPTIQQNRSRMDQQQQQLRHPNEQ